MKSTFLSLLMFAFLLLTNAHAQGLKYGDVVTLQNKWNNYSGGFLDTRGYQKDFEKTGNHLCVSTATSDNRDAGSGSWKILSASGKKAGEPVLVGDQIHLQNQWNGGKGGFLDARGYQKDFEKAIGNFLCVSTATVQNRDGGSGTWKIWAFGVADGTPVINGFDVQLQNGWNKFGGGFLDTNGWQKDHKKTGNHLCVSTSKERDRANGKSATWRLLLKK